MNHRASVRAILLDHFKRYTSSYLKAFGYALLASLGAFTTLFSELTRDKATALAWWQICALIVNCIIPGVAAIMAFLNTSVAKIDAEKKVDDARENPPPPVPVVVVPKPPDPAVLPVPVRIVT